jgi:DNA-binding CsgD family transcriptional regulator
VGRDEELALVARRLGGGAVASVVVVGGAGVGKSRLLQAAADAARAGGVVVVAPVLATRAAASIPFGAFADLVPDSTAALTGPALLRAVSSSLRHSGHDGHPPLLVIDDAHLLDAASAALVLNLAATGDAAMMIVAVRSGEPCPDAITALWKDRGALRLDLQPLSPAEVTRLLEAALPGGMVTTRLAQQVAGHSGGNPLYCRELVLAGLAAGSIGQAGGLWRQTGPPVLSQRLAELLHERMGVLSAVEREALELVVLAEPAELGLLERLTGPVPLAALEQRRLIAVDGTAPPRVRLGHPLYGDVIRQDMGEVRRRQLGTVLADALEERGDPGPRSLLRAATWRLEAGTARPGLLTRAAVAASTLSDQQLAVQLASEALRLGGGADAGLALARAEVRRNHLAAAEEALAPWEGRAGSQDQAKEYITERVPLVRWGLSRPPDADALLGRARAWHPTATWRQYLQGWAVLLAEDAGQLEEAARLGQDLLGQPGLEPDTRLLAAFPTSVALLFTGHSAQARQVVDACFQLARRLGPELREYAWAVLAMWVGVRLETGRDAGVVEPLARQAYRYALDHDDEELLGLSAIVLGRIALCQGALGAARQHLAEAAVHLTDCDPRQQHGVGLAMLAQTEALCGNPAAAQAALARAAADYPVLQATHWLSRREYTRARIWLAAAEGDPAAAQHAALAAADDNGQFLLTEITFCHDALRLGHPAPAIAGRLAKLAGRTDAELPHAMAAHAQAAAASDPAALEAVAERFAAAGAFLLAAEAQAAAARTYAGHGHTANARRATARAHQLAAACPGARTPLLQAPPVPGLTAREQQVARLAAQGLTSDQIAQRLVISVRTAESHLYHVFRKLGVHTRNELQALLADGTSAAHPASSAQAP